MTEEISTSIAIQHLQLTLQRLTEHVSDIGWSAMKIAKILDLMNAREEEQFRWRMEARRAREEPLRPLSGKI